MHRRPPAARRPATALLPALLLAALACGGSGDSRSAGAAGAVRAVSPDDVTQLVSRPDGPLLVDVRTPEEYRSGHVPGAVNIPHTELPGQLDRLAPYKERGVVTYCESGRRAGVALDALAGAGFRNLGHLEGDMGRWRREGRPVVAGDRPIAQQGE